jgi:hypothetical protein
MSTAYARPSYYCAADCGALVARRCARCHSCRWGKTGAAKIDSVTRFADDPEAISFVATHPGGGTLEEVGEMFDLTRERIRQIEERALAKLVDRLRLAGVHPADVAEMLASKAGLERRSA